MVDNGSFYCPLMVNNGQSIIDQWLTNHRSMTDQSPPGNRPIIGQPSLAIFGNLWSLICHALATKSWFGWLVCCFFVICVIVLTFVANVLPSCCQFVGVKSLEKTTKKYVDLQPARRVKPGQQAVGTESAYFFSLTVEGHQWRVLVG